VRITARLNDRHVEACRNMLAALAASATVVAQALQPLQGHCPVKMNGEIRDGAT
jgi:hypothetical protein